MSTEAKKTRAKARIEETYDSLCDKRRELRAIISQMNGEGWTWELCRMMACMLKEMGRLVRIKEVSFALNVPEGSLGRSCAKMGVTIPKATNNRQKWERDLMERAEKDIPLAHDEGCASPGVGGCAAQDNGIPPTPVSDERGDGCEGECITDTPDVGQPGGEEHGEEFPAVGGERREGGPLQGGLRQLFPSIGVASEGFWGCDIHDGDVDEAPALDAFGNGSVPRHLRHDRFVRMREQNSTLRSKLESCERRNEELVSEVARLGSVDSRIRRELDRAKRDTDHWYNRASDLQRQLIDARTELGAIREECRRLQGECQHLKGAAAALNTEVGWRKFVGECQNENWQLKRALDGLRVDMQSRASELDALREDVRKAQFAEANQHERAKQMEEELARMRAASAAKESEEDAVFGQACPLATVYRAFFPW
jgi:hypothetical protein